MIPLNGNKRTSIAFSLLRGRSIEQGDRQQKAADGMPKYPGAILLKDDMAISGKKWSVVVYGPINNEGKPAKLEPDEMNQIALGISTTQGLDDGVSFSDLLSILGNAVQGEGDRNPNLGPLSNSDYTFRRPGCDKEALGHQPESLPRRWYKNIILSVFKEIIDALDNPHNAFTKILVSESTRGKGKGTSAGMLPIELLGCTLQIFLKFKNIISYEDLTPELKELFNKDYLDVYAKKLNLRLNEFTGQQDQGPLGENVNSREYSQISP